MTALIWKEFREHLRWAVLWLLGLTIAFVCLLAPQRNPYLAGWTVGLCDPTVELVTTIGGALGGFLLGLLQSVPDSRRDRRGFLLHRPLSPTRIFAGKVLGGLALYIPATLLPLLGAAAWLATPGQFAFPCPWQTLLPGLADIAAGVVCYLAGLLTGWRPARWYGSRGLGVAAAILCIVFVQGLPEFADALLVVAAGVLVFGLAGNTRPSRARPASRSPSRYRPASGASRSFFPSPRTSYSDRSRKRGNATRWTSRAASCA